MGVISNLYLIPKPAGAAPARDVREIAAELVRERLVRGPVYIGSPFRERGRVIEPQQPRPHDQAWVDDNGGRRFADPDDALAAIEAAAPPAIVMFEGLNEHHPSIQKDFDLYTGYECSIAGYDAPDGFELTLTGEPDPRTDETEGELIFSRTIFQWLHLQGKVAPWPDIYNGSELDRTVRRFWPDLDVVELAYL